MSWFRRMLGGGGGDKPADDGRLPVLATVQIEPQMVEVRGDQVLRRAFSIDQLKAEGIPTIEHLPVIESEAEVILPSAEAVARRLAALAVVAVKGEGLESERVGEIVAERGMADWFSPREAAFIADRAPSEHDRTQFVWRYEAAWVMFWALNFVEGRLGIPRAICDVPRLAGTVRDTPDLAIHGLHPVGHVVTEADLAYRLHWAVRNTQIKGEPIPGGLEPGVVMERHYALNWLIRHREEPWDEVDTST